MLIVHEVLHVFYCDLQFNQDLTDSMISFQWYITSFRTPEQVHWPHIHALIRLPKKCRIGSRLQNLYSV